LALARTRLAGHTAVFLSATGKELAYQEKSIGWLNPDNVLKRGYTISLVDGALARGIAQVREGQTLKTIFTDGTVTTKVDPSSTIEIYPQP
jgi:exodeoxyribonuclease VII large subunit